MEVVCGIIEEDGRYLIARRKSKVHNNIWEFPGGKVEEQETKEEAIIREIKEELELDIEVTQFFCDIVDHRETFDIHVSAFLCKKVAGEIKLHAHHEYRYVSASELFDYKFEEADYDILHKLQKI